MTVSLKGKAMYFKAFCMPGGTSRSLLQEQRNMEVKMNGILILAHGSKRKEADKVLDSLIRKVKDKTGEQLVLPSCLQFSKQNLEAGIEELIQKGADKIKIIPLFLFDGIHVTQDIPEELEAIAAKHPGLEIKLGRHLGDDDRIADIIADRIKEI